MKKPTLPLNQSRYYMAVFLVITAHISLSTMGVFVKFSANDVPVSEILFFRFFLGLLLITPIAIKGKYLSIKTKNNKYFSLRNMAGLLSMLFMFYSLNILPISVSVLLINTSTLFVPLMLFLLFREKTSLSVLMCTMAGFVGVFITLASPHHPVPLISLLIGLLSAGLAALSYIGIRTLSKEMTPSQIVFYFHLTSSMVIVTFLSYNWVLPSWHTLYLLVMVGFFGVIFQISLTKALTLANLPTIMPFTFIGVIASAVFDWAFWNNTPSVSFWLGGSVIMISVSLLLRCKAATTCQ